MASQGTAASTSQVIPKWSSQYGPVASIGLGQKCFYFLNKIGSLFKISWKRIQADDIKPTKLGALGQSVSLENVKIIPNPAETLLAFWNQKEHSLSICPTSFARDEVLPLVKLLADEEDLVWVGWHPASAHGSHLLALGCHGSLRMWDLSGLVGKNGDISRPHPILLLKIRSPEDFTLKCVNASFPAGSQLSSSSSWSWATLWVVLENGDVLSVCPLIPYPCKIDKLWTECLKDSFNSESFGDFKDEQLFLGELLKKGLLIDDSYYLITSPPRSHADLLPMTIGPFRIQPEQQESFLSSGILPFSYDGIDFLILRAANKLSVALIAQRSVPSWRRVDVKRPLKGSFSNSLELLPPSDLLSPLLSIICEIPLSETKAANEIQLVQMGSFGVVIQVSSGVLILLDWLDKFVKSFGEVKDEDANLLAPLKQISSPQIFQAFKPSEGPSVIVGKRIQEEFTLVKLDKKEGKCMLAQVKNFIKSSKRIAIPDLSEKLLSISKESLESNLTLSYQKFSIPKIHLSKPSLIFPSGLSEETFLEEILEGGERISQSIGKCLELANELQRRSQAIIGKPFEEDEDEEEDGKELQGTEDSSSTTTLFDRLEAWALQLEQISVSQSQKWTSLEAELESAHSRNASLMRRVGRLVANSLRNDRQSAEFETMMERLAQVSGRLNGLMSTTRFEFERLESTQEHLPSAAPILTIKEDLIDKIERSLKTLQI